MVDVQRVDVGRCNARHAVYELILPWLLPLEHVGLIVTEVAACVATTSRMRSHWSPRAKCTHASPPDSSSIRRLRHMRWSNRATSSGGSSLSRECSVCVVRPLYAPAMLHMSVAGPYERESDIRSPRSGTLCASIWKPPQIRWSWLLI